MHATVKALAGAVTFDDELKLRLDWSVSVKLYNLAKQAGENLDPPIAEAVALLSKYPQYAQRVQDGWAGGGRGRYYRGNPKKYWPHQIDAKMAPIISAVPMLSPLHRAELLRSWTNRYYDSGPNIADANAVRECLSANPKYVNSKSGPIVTQKYWHSLTIEEAKALSTHLAMNANPEASLIRAIAAGGKDYDKVLAAFRGPEAWRLGAADLGGSNTDRLWHYTGRPGDTRKRDAEIAKSKALAKTIAAGDVKKDAPAPQRIAAFRKLWSDFRSAKPKIPGVHERLVRVLQFTPEALGELLRDKSPEAQILARDAIAKGLEDFKGPLTRDAAVRGLSPSQYDPSILRLALRHHGMDWLKKNGKELYAPHPLETMLRQAVADSLKRGQAEPWLIMAWINAQFPEDNAESVRLMAAMFKSPAWKALPFEVRYAAQTWFKDAAMTPAQYAYVRASDPELVCKDLLALPEDADVKATLAALSKAIDGVDKSPVRIEIVGLDQLAALDDAVFADPKVFAQILRATDSSRMFAGSQLCGNRLLKVVTRQRLPGVLHRIAPYLWRHTELYHRSLPGMIDLARSMVDTNPSAASAMALGGLETFARYSRGHRYFTPETDIPQLKAIRGKAALAMGLIDIPVRASNPAYPIYKSQSEFAIGNEDSARELYDTHADELLAVHRNLSPAYLLWVLQRTIDQRDQERQESLVKALLTWRAESSGAFALDQRAGLEIACGDIAMQRGMLPEAHKIFTSIQRNKSYEGIEARNVAAMRRVRVERISKDFDAALQTLSEIDAQRIPRLTTAAHYARAEVYYDMQEYQDSADEIAKVLERQPAHADAIILRGRVQLQRHRLIEATEVELGTASSQKTLVPGETLKVTLNDPTLAVSSSGSEIEVVVWATSGDKEHLLLRQFGDVRTKYRGEVKTALGKPVPDDRTLQVIGDDKIFYAYSERFRKKVTKLDENRGGPIIVASDAIIMASARKLLSESEQRLADMAAVTAALDAKHYSSAEREDPIRLAELKAQAKARSQTALIQARVKPGNPIHVRVIDPDRSRTAEIDELPISVASSSGDSIDRVMLKETGTHTGYFEGTVSTANAQAMASASSTETGLNPNMAISPNPSYPAWRPVAAKNAEHGFTVDLNDNLPLGSMEIEARDASFGLKSFVIQTAMNYRSWTTVARYSDKLQADPDAPADVSGRKPSLRYSIPVPHRWQPSIAVTNEAGLRQERGARSVYELSDLRRHLEYGWLKDEWPQAFAQNVTGPSQALPESVLTSVKWMRRYNRKQNNPAVAVRFQAYFYEPRNVTRRFALTLGKHAIPSKGRQKNPPEFLLAVDGRVITTKDAKLQGQLNLRAGVHRLEIWATGWINNIGFGRTLKLRANLNGDETMVDCPDSFFDAKSFPEGILDHANSPARISANEDGTTFKVSFAPDSRARLLRIVFVDQQGPVPSLNHLKLSDPQGAVLLPIPTDFAELHKNELLEILTGDKVTIRYVDDRHVTKGKQKHERFLNVAYSNGGIEFADIEPRYSSRHHKKMPYREELLRFRYDKPLSVVVHDPDMDVSVEADQVTLTIESPTGGKRQMVAKETGPSTGTFKAMVTPVADATTDDSQIQVAEGGMIVAVYRDAENDKPGVPTERYARIEHAAFHTPVIAVAHMTVTPVEAEATVTKQTLTEDFTPRYIAMTTGRRAANNELISPHFQIKQSYVESTDAPDGIELVQGRHALIDIVAPHLALGVNSSIEVYIQTDSGRKLASKNSFNPSKPLPFDIDAPGTLRLEAHMGLLPRNDTPQRGGYLSTGVQGQGNVYQQTANSYKAGRFRICVPLVPGMQPEHSYTDPERVRELRLPRPNGLTVRTGERIHIGVLYEDRQGKKQWVTTSAKIVTRPMLDVMQEGYRNLLTEAFVGEKVRLRVVDFARDTSDNRDELRVYMASKSGAKHYLTLRETDIHSGIFKGVYQLTYASAKPVTNGTDTANAAEYNVKRQGFPVVYGDAVGVRYTDASGQKTPVQYLKIGKGADGEITPFCKQYDDSAINPRIVQRQTRPPVPNLPLRSSQAIQPQPVSRTLRSKRRWTKVKWDRKPHR